MKDIFESKAFNKAILTLGILIAILFIFQAGIFVGYKRASMSMTWDSAYGRGLNDPRSPFAPFARHPDDRNPHGAFGEVVSFMPPEILIKGPNATEQIAVVSTTTSIRKFRETASTSDIIAGTQIIIIGNPDEAGRVRAELIRILPQR